jgi:superfamily II DNA or RNA helicase
MTVLRWYQEQSIADLRRAIGAGAKRVILQLATGGGKTATAGAIARMARDKGRAVLFLAPRRELIYQARDAFKREGLTAAVVMAGEWQQRHGYDLIVASFDTLHARCIRSERMELPPADMLIVDEAHILGKTREDIIRAYPDAVVIGLTATPCRTDGKGLGALYDDMVIGVDIGRLTAEGYLVPARYFSPSEPDLEGVKLAADGDYQAKSLSGRVNTPTLIGDVVDHWHRLAAGRPTVVFAVDRAHARALQAAFDARQVPTRYVDGETPATERADALASIQDGRALVLVNVFVATYGLDLPRLEVCVLARPTKSLGLYLQMVGRCLRPSPGKTEALVIDHSGAVRRLGFAADDHPWSLDAAESIGDRIERQKAERKEPKEITCSNCSTVFSGRRSCPTCGFELIPKGEPIPCHEFQLEEVSESPAKRNRQWTWEQKAEFMGGLKTIARMKGYRDGWAANQYREKFGVWPNDPRVRQARMCPVSPELAGWIKHRQIAWAKRRQA